MKALIVIPTYNEIENLPRLINRLLKLEEDIEILVVDDNSPDGTADWVKAQALKNSRIHLLQRAKKMGIGPAYVSGFKWALMRDYDVIQEMDADLSHRPRYIPTFMKQIQSHDVVVGSRWMDGGRIANWPASRILLSRLANLYAKWVLGVPICDLTGGFVCYRREVLENLNLDTLRSDGYSFQIEMKYRALKNNFRLKEFPIVFTDRKAGESKISRQIVIEALLMVILLKLRNLHVYDFFVRPFVIFSKIAAKRDYVNGRQYINALKKCDLSLSSPIEQKTLEEIIREKPGADLVNPTQRDGNLSLETLHALASLVKHFQPERIFEIGTFNGNSSMQMSVNSSDSCRIFTLDLPKQNLLESKTRYSLGPEDRKYVGCPDPDLVFRQTPYESKIECLTGDSASFDYQSFHKNMDFIFIDGSHTYEYVKSDTENAFKMAAPGAVIIWDDYDPSWPDVIRYLNYLAKTKLIYWIRGTSLCFFQNTREAEIL